MRSRGGSFPETCSGKRIGIKHLPVRGGLSSARLGRYPARAQDIEAVHHHGLRPAAGQCSEAADRGEPNYRNRDRLRDDSVLVMPSKRRYTDSMVADT